MPHIVHIIPSSVLHDKSLYEALNHMMPDLSNFLVCSCLWFVSSHATQRGKLDPRSHRSVLLGFKPGIKAFIIFNPQIKQIQVSRNVTFYENPCFLLPKHKTLVFLPIMFFLSFIMFLCLMFLKRLMKILILQMMLLMLPKKY